MFFRNLGFFEILLILVILLLLFGGKKLPQLGRALGETIQSFKRSFKDDAKERQE